MRNFRHHQHHGTFHQNRGHRHWEMPLSSPADGPLSDETLLCRCHHVTVAQVKEAIASGACTCEQVMAVTSLGTACSRCTAWAWPIIQRLIDEKGCGPAAEPVPQD